MTEDTGHPTEVWPTAHRAAAAVSPGRVLGRRYEIRRLLGRGGMGEVWLAYDLRLRVEIALKVLRGGAFERAESRERLRREVRQARAVVSPNVCRVFDLVELELGRTESHQPETIEELVSMEYVDGVTLLEHLRSKGALDLADATQIATQMLAGLEAIHGAGLVHRDLKPENIMITRTGRVVLMDFGIAKALEDGTGTIAGTPAYMPPEQRRGEALDARADVFAAGVVLAEMMGAEQLTEGDSRQALRAGLHEQPPQVPKGPWQKVIQRAVADDRERRFSSASSLARALEEISERERSDEDRSPYPGLASFTEEDAALFFGREAEVEALWRRLSEQHLLALVGASGAGKSSMLRAGVVANAPDGWSHVIFKPGEAPFRALAEALVPALSGDEQAMRLLVGIEDPERAVGACQQWRKGADEALLIVDQFEELFTLCPTETQARFAQLLGLLALEADIHVLVSMRDDFLLNCGQHAALQPLFSELTPLNALSGSALRRALVQPALACGYHFEDDRLVDDMLAEIADERGALPLLAFAAAALWQQRDRQHGVLTRAAYESIGGVSGALARHAESTLEHIGPAGLEHVRELFRNLVTGQGTRAVRDRRELLSVFSEQRPAAEVLDSLVDARLLTTFDVPGDGEGAETPEPRQMVEIIHESLLSAWPRLVQWQSQDAGAARQRDQLRQAARLWQERGRPDELLWSGPSFKEFELWLERYGGALSANEEAFSQAMIDRAGRRRRRQLIALVAVLLVALGVATVMTALWRRSDSDRRAAIAAELRTQAQLALDSDPSFALAYAIKSLEAADSRQARQLTREILWRGPPVRVQRLHADPRVLKLISWSPDGQWLATSAQGALPGLNLVPSDGGDVIRLELPFEFLGEVDFLENGSSLAMIGGIDEEGTENTHWRVYEQTVPDGDIRPVLDVPPDAWARFLRGGRLVTLHEVNGEVSGHIVRSWPLEHDATGRGLGVVPAVTYGDILPDLTQLVATDGRRVSFHALSTSLPASGGQDLESPLQLLLARDHDADIDDVRVAPSGNRLLIDQDDGDFVVWKLEGGAVVSTHSIDNPERGLGLFAPRFDSTGRLVAWGSSGNNVRLWDLEAPPDVEPVTRLIRHGEDSPHSASFDPQGRWIAAAHDLSLSMWPLEWPWTRVYPGHGAQIQRPPVLAPSGDTMLTCSTRGAAIWSLVAGGDPMRWVGNEQRGYCSDVAIHPSEELAAVVFFGGRTFLLPLSGGEEREFSRQSSTGTIAFHPSQARVVQFVWRDPTPEQRINSLVVWRTDTGEQEAETDIGESFPLDLEFAPDGQIYSAGRTGIHRWNPQSGEIGVVLAAESATLDLHPNGRELLVAWGARDFESAEPGALLDTRLAVLDLESGSRREIDTHGSAVQQVAYGPKGQVIVTGDSAGNVRVGLASGEEPHLLPGLPGRVVGVAIAPDGNSVWATAGTEVRQWSMPDLARAPLLSRPFDELLATLKSFTNLRVVESPNSDGGWTISIGPFPGWQDVPVW